MPDKADYVVASRYFGESSICSSEIISPYLGVLVTTNSSLSLENDGNTNEKELSTTFSYIIRVKTNVTVDKSKLKKLARHIPSEVTGNVQEERCVGGSALHRGSIHMSNKFGSRLTTRWQ